MNRLLLAPLLLLAACGGASPPVDVVGPFTGNLHRFYVSAITLPMQRTDFSVDLSGDGRVDNQLGNIVGGLAANRDASDYVDEIVAARVIDATVELISDDPNLVGDATVGVTWNGVAGEPGELTGGVLKDAILTTNLVQFTHHPAAGKLSVPVFKDADPSLLTLVSYQLTLFADGAGGFAGQLNAVASTEGLATHAWPQFQQMLAAHPEDHAQLVEEMDKNHDGTVSLDEFTHDGLFLNLTAPDVPWDGSRTSREGTKTGLSVGIALSLTPCIDAACTRPLPAPTCHDRRQNGDEQKVDCGGSCEPCLP